VDPVRPTPVIQQSAATLMPMTPFTWGRTRRKFSRPAPTRTPDCQPAFGASAVAHVPVGRVIPGGAIVTAVPLIASTFDRCVWPACWLSAEPFQEMSPDPVLFLSLTQ